MIRAVAETRDGMAVLLGITEGNVERLKAGMPLTLDLGALMVEAMRGFEDDDRPIEQPYRGKLQLFISYQPTHVEIVQEWIRAGLPVGAEMLEQARQIDATA